MAFIVVGEVLGRRQRSGNLDNGDPWKADEISILGDGDFEATFVRVDKFPENVPERGDTVALAVELRYGKIHAVRRLPAVESALLSA